MYQQIFRCENDIKINNIDSIDSIIKVLGNIYISPKQVALPF